MASEIYNAPPSQSISKKKRSSASKQIRPSAGALVPVQTMPEPRFSHISKVYEHQDNFATEAERRVDNQKWDAWAESHPSDIVSLEDVAVGTDYRGRTKIQKMHSGGKRAKFYGDVVGYDGTANGKLEEEFFEKPSKSKSRVNVGNNRKEFDKIDEDTAILDADYENVYETVPPRDPKNVGFGRPKRQEPSAMKAISKKKSEMKSQVTNLASPKNRVDEGSALVSPTKRVSSEKLVKPSQKTRKPYKDPVDVMFDGLSDATKGIVGIGKTVAKAGVTGIGAGFQALDAGAKAFGASTIGQNIKAQSEADYKHMRSHAMRAAESIKGTAGKKDISAGSLVTLKGHRNVHSSHSSESGSGYSGTPKEIHGFTCKYVKGSHGDVHKAWFYKGQPVEYSDVQKYLTSEEVTKLRKSAEDIFKGHIDIGLSCSSNRGTPALTKKGGHGLVKGTKAASFGGLITHKRNRGSYDSDYGYEPAYGNNQVIAGTTNKTVSGLVTNKTNADGIATMKTHSDVVVGTGKIGNVKTTQTATPEGLITNKTGGVQVETREAHPSGLATSQKGGVHAETREATRSGINKRKSGGICAETRPATSSKINKRKSGGIHTETHKATPSQLVGRTGDSEKTIAAGVTRRDGEIGTVGSSNGIVSKSKPVTLGSIITPRRNVGGNAA